MKRLCGRRHPLKQLNYVVANATCVTIKAVKNQNINPEIRIENIIL